VRAALKAMPDSPRMNFAVGLVRRDASVSWLGPESELPSLLGESGPSIDEACRKALEGKRSSATALNGLQIAVWPLEGSKAAARAVVAVFAPPSPDGSRGFHDDFCSLISHELKTPVAALRMHIDYLIRALSQDGMSEFRRTKLLEMARTGLGMIDVLTDLIENLVRHVEFFEGDILLERTPFDLSELVIDISSRLRSQLMASECTLSLAISTRSPGYWDKPKIDQLVVCLLMNAMKYGSGKPIQVEIGQEKEMTRLSVIDQGIGVHPDDHERIFNRFERASNSAGYSGIGLGLFIARKIVEAHGGRIGIQSALNQGCRMDVVLPGGSPGS
jgi:signal transduction histidine kinase